MYEPLVPFVKWVGGKRRLLPELVKRLPKEFKNYFEPFIGGGALLLHLEPKLIYQDKQIYINDLNPVLVHTYKTIKENPSKLMDLLYIMDDLNVDKPLFYQIRDNFNEKIKNNVWDIEMAALFIFLQKRSFNGIFRSNKKGLYMVSASHTLNVESYNASNIYGISKFLKEVNISNLDFEEALKNVQKGDFVFLDPPYDPDSKGFVMRYDKVPFTKNDQIRLANLYKELDQKGVYLMLTNHGTSLIRELYQEYRIEEVPIRRFLQRSGDRQGSEVIITNYNWEEQN